ncbi:unnamed protein product, partial [Durusdinium trenchii]
VPQSLVNKFKEAVGDAKVGHALGNALSVAPMERLLRNVVVAANLCRPEQQPPDFWGKISSKVPRFDCEKHAADLELLQKDKIISIGWAEDVCGDFNLVKWKLVLSDYTVCRRFIDLWQISGDKARDGFSLLVPCLLPKIC